MSKIYFVSSGTPTPTKSRFGTSYVLQLGYEFLMFDCGPAATHKLVKLGLFPTQIDYLFFTDEGKGYPNWLVHMFIVDGPFEMVSNLKELVNKNQ